MRKFRFGDAGNADSGLVRATALTFVGAVAILGLYVGQDVLIPAAIAVLIAFILSPLVTWVRRCCRCRLPSRWW